jgi:hypothetical protein
VFAAAEGVAPPPVPPPPPAPAPKPSPKPPTARPAPITGPPAQSKPGRSRDDGRGKRTSQYPEYDDENRPPTRRRKIEEEDDGLTPEERQERSNQYLRAMWGARLIYLSFVLQAVSLLVVLVFLIRNAISEPTPEIIIVAGLFGLSNWILGAIGLVLCLFGRPSPGYLVFGIPAAVAIVAHGIFLLALVAKNAEKTAILGFDLGGEVDQWGQMPTKFDSLTVYLTSIAYPDEYQRFVPKKAAVLAFFTGVSEMIRLVLIMMTLSCAARAAGDEELAYRCVRAGGIGSLGPGALALLMLLLVGALVETGGIDRDIGVILIHVFVMGIYAILCGMLVPVIVASRDTADASEFPFQSQRFNIGD